MSPLGDAALEQRLQQARDLIAKQSYGPAAKLLTILVHASPDDPRPWHLLGNAQFRLGKHAAAIEAHKRHVALEPSNPVASYNLGAAYAELGRRDEARRHLQQALSLKPDFPEAVARLAAIDGAGAGGGGGETPAPFGGKGKRELLAGELLFEGRQLLRSRLGPLLAAVAISVLGSLAIGATPDIRPTADRIGRVEQAEERVRLAGGPASPITDQLQLELDQARASADRWDDRLRGAYRFVSYATALFGMVLFAYVALAALLTKYRFHERRIDIERGVLRRTHDSVWLYEVTDPQFRQPLSMLIMDTGKILVRLERRKRPYAIVGFAEATTMRGLWEQLRDAVANERYEIKGIFV